MKRATMCTVLLLLTGCASAAADGKPWYLIVPPLKGLEPDVSLKREAWLLERAYPTRDACFEALLSWRELEKGNEGLRRQAAESLVLFRRIVAFIRAQAERPDDFLLEEKRQEIAAAARKGNLTSLSRHLYGAAISGPISKEDLASLASQEQILEIQMQEMRRQDAYFIQRARGECLPANMVPDTVLPAVRR